MFTSNIARSVARTSGARSVARRQLHTTQPRPAMMKKRQDGTSEIQWSPMTYAMLGAAIIGVCGTYGMLMASPRTMVSKEDQVGTSSTSKANQPRGRGLDPNNPQ
ncbi:hypothetical protein QBC35DRAFT_77244 [Podospora australis]|uniref:Uncharacterized protein n=1 Tax=Podospora australis TaxID=1536484 RepID=A0AAN6WL66_9PEZI|nr:hypothetical protein QBC35DRAFT_77244 [Podospora australis]